MHARAPIDVDLEDRLLYGLTPVRLGYVAVGALAALAAWSAGWLPGPVRGPLALVPLLVAAAASWGRWQGRAVDGWVADLAVWTVRNHVLRVDREALDGWVGRARDAAAAVRSGRLHRLSGRVRGRAPVEVVTLPSIPEPEAGRPR